MSSMPLITTPSASAVIGCAIAVHKELGAGLFESVYQPCLAYELRAAGLRFQEQVIAPVKYRDVVLPRAFKIDFVVEEELIVEVKAVEQVLEIHNAQVLTYMKLTGIRKALMFNFCVPVLKDGIRSFVR